MEDPGMVCFPRARDLIYRQEWVYVLISKKSCYQNRSIERFWIFKTTSIFCCIEFFFFFYNSQVSFSNQKM